MIPTGGRAAAVLIGVPLVLAASGWSAFNMVGLFANASEHHAASYAWSGGEISLSSSSGYVHISSGAGDRVEVSYTEHYQLKKPTISATTADGGVRLVAKCPGGIFSNNCAVNYDITVPPAAHVVVHTGDGGLRLRGLAGGVDASTGDGGIVIDDLSGPLVADTGDGGISATGLRSTTVDAQTGDGGIALAWATQPDDVRVRTGDGGIRLRLPVGSGPYNVSATTGDGRSSVTVPTDRSAAASITAHTGDGGISISYSAGGAG